MKRVIFVHGRDQQGKDRNKLKAEWISAWDEGLAKSALSRPQGLDIDFPVYADRLIELINESSAPASTDAAAKGELVGDKFDDFRREVFMEIERERNIPPAVVRAEIARVHGPQVVDEKGPLNWEWLQALIRLIDGNAPGMSGGVLSLLVRDVYMYATDTGIQNEIDGLVTTDLSDKTAIVVGHSLGSVVTFNVLRRYATAHAQRPKFITVGSPLGIVAIRRLLGRLSNPASGGDWYNAFDPRDGIALNPLDAEHFNVAPAVTNFSGVSNKTDNRHGIIGYLDDKAVARRIYDAVIAG